MKLFRDKTKQKEVRKIITFWPYLYVLNRISGADLIPIIVTLVQPVLP